MNRYIALNNFDKMETFEYEEKFDYNSPYVVDDSNFVPLSEAVKQLGSNQIGQDIINQYYDFPAGKDNGSDVPFSRTKECNDIAVLSSKIANDTADLADKVSKNKAKAAERAAFEADLKATAAAANSSGTNTTK